MMRRALLEWTLVCRMPSDAVSAAVVGRNLVVASLIGDLAEEEGMKRVLKLIVAVSLAAAAVSFVGSSAEVSDGAPCPAGVTAWLAGHAIPFDTTDPDAPHDDLEPLRDIIGDARIVALGEQTHGTKEFFDMKHRIFRFLVEEMGFRIFAFEADWYGLMALNACLLPDGPPIETAFRNLAYWTWQTEEVMALLQWMRAYNEATPGRPVQLVGLDVNVYVDH